MAGDKYESIISVVALGAGLSSVIPHGLKFRDTAIQPDGIEANGPTICTVTYDATNVTVTNPGTTAQSASFRVYLNDRTQARRGFQARRVTTQINAFIWGGASGLLAEIAAAIAAALAAVVSAVNVQYALAVPAANNPFAWLPSATQVAWVDAAVSLATGAVNEARISFEVETAPASGVYTQRATVEIPALAVTGLGTHKLHVGFPVPPGCRFRYQVSGNAGSTEIVDLVNALAVGA